MTHNYKNDYDGLIIGLSIIIVVIVIIIIVIIGKTALFEP
jgi:hypothetical protein